MSIYELLEDTKQGKITITEASNLIFSDPILYTTFYFVCNCAPKHPYTKDYRAELYDISGILQDKFLAKKD